MGMTIHTSFILFSVLGLQDFSHSCGGNSPTLTGIVVVILLNTRVKIVLFLSLSYIELQCLVDCIWVSFNMDFSHVLHHIDV